MEVSQIRNMRLNYDLTKLHQKMCCTDTDTKVTLWFAYIRSALLQAIFYAKICNEVFYFSLKQLLNEAVCTCVCKAKVLSVYMLWHKMNYMIW